MSQKERPLSPHLQIYKPQITSVLSITHRITGAALSAGVFVLLLWIFSLSLGPESYGIFTRFIHSWVGKFFLMGWTFSFYYHLANGIRHLFWDMGKGYSLKATYRTGWFVLLFSLSLTISTSYFFILKG